MNIVQAEFVLKMFDRVFKQTFGTKIHEMQITEKMHTSDRQHILQNTELLILAKPKFFLFLNKVSILLSGGVPTYSSWKT